MTFRFHSRLAVWNLLIIAVISSFLGYFLSYSLRDDIERQVEGQLREESELAAAFLAKADRARSFDDLADDLSTMLGVRVTLIALDGKVLGDSDLEGAALENVENHRNRPEVQQALKEDIGQAVRWSPTVRVQFIYVAKRTDAYVLRLAKPLSAVDALITDLQRQLAFAMLIAIAVTLAFGSLVRGLISKPLRQIATASKELAAGDFSQRLPITGDEEIAMLGSSLNTMAENLSAKIQELSEGKQRLELILGAMGEGVMVLDAAGRISLTNRSLQELFAKDRELIGRTALEAFRNPNLDSAIRNALAGRAAQVVELTTDSGRVLRANAAPVRNASGIIDSVVVVFLDLTDVRRTERMRRDFVANVSHEFKTPLTSIRGYAETLLSGARDDPKIASEFLKVIERNAEHLEALVRDLLTLARLEAELPTAKEAIDIRALIDEQVSARLTSLKEHEIRLTVECPPIQFDADPSRLSMALSNLIDNAIQYNERGGEIRIAGRRDDGVFSLSITDTGPGIRSEELPRIFERFYRIDKARTRDSGGTGLGLSIVKHAVESQGGSLSVSSTPGSGSTFTIRIPM